ncbi:hypothetical protein LUZ61_001672 [Rhynchospora tenuis]|uniref:AB hydrolase-1 domain-containing protein n=1 Tax=Rhynchospora tenuis TaxID=198213 RepID=A0AAD5ZHG4_9POAL|nr:hypothetical protein LUZ61_001672 [Rhynchospora tenuis]
MPPLLASMATSHCAPSPLLPRARASVSAGRLPPFLPKEVDRIKDCQVIELAKRIERVPVKIDSVKKPIMSSCIKPLQQDSNEAVVLVHGFDSSCLEWRYTYSLLEEAGVEAWAVDILGWGFSNLETLPPCDVSTKREHLYQLWASYIKKPMVLVGASLGAAVAVDFSVNYPEAVSKLVFVGACVYTEGTGNMTKLPKFIAYAGVNVLKILPLRLYAMKLAFNNVPNGSLLDWTRVGQLHCHLPWWKEATVGFMRSGGYNVVDLIKQVKQKTLIIWGEDDKIVSKEFATKLYNDIEDSVLHLIPNCGHLPHVERPQIVSEQILSFCAKENAVRQQLHEVPILYK